MIFLSERFSFRSSSTDLLDAHEIKKFDMKSRKKKYCLHYHTVILIIHC